jgi:hypothetical protein
VNDTTRYSSGSTSTSPFTMIVTVFAVSPEANVTVPLAGAVVRRFMHELLAGGDLGVADEVLAPDYVNVAMGGADLARA